MTNGKAESHPELVFGLVGAVGVDFDPVVKALSASLSDIGYRKLELIRLSELLRNYDVWDGKPPKGEMPEDERISAYMTAGNKLRELAKRGDALIGPTVEKIWKYRESEGAQDEEALPETIPNCAYILLSLKHPDEVRRLQTLYGPGFVLIGVFLPEESLIEKLKRKIAGSHQTHNIRKYTDRAKQLITRDSFEPETDFGQNVRDTFTMSDVFVDSSDENALNNSIQRFVNLMFSHPNHTPTRDEFSMYQAYSAALLSSSLNRQVGASITTSDGQLVSMGTNEVPKPLGGIYWEDERESEDDRDFQRGQDSNELMQNEILKELIEKLELKEGVTNNIYEIRKKLSGTRLLDLIEFHRAVHAETSALLDAARRGVAVQGCTLHCTTFPCHNCAGNIIAAGIKRVVYIEPYPKSKARDFFEKAFTTTPADKRRVYLAPFVGVGPRRFRDLFSTTTSGGKKILRMDNKGRAISPDDRHKELKWGTLNTSQVENEGGFLKNLENSLDSLRIQAKGEDI